MNCSYTFKARPKVYDQPIFINYWLVAYKCKITFNIFKIKITSILLVTFGESDVTSKVFVSSKLVDRF